MPNATLHAGGFHADLITMLPRLRIHALSLTRDRDRADDLVQETVAKALAGQKSFRPGTCLSAWMHRILRNEFISGVRRQRPSAVIDDTISNALSHPPHQEHGLLMQEFMTAFGKLNVSQREALVLSAVGGQTCEQIARQTGVAVGTVKSRVSRARDLLERLLLDEEAGPKRRPVVDAPAPRRSVRTARLVLEE